MSKPIAFNYREAVDRIAELEAGYKALKEANEKKNFRIAELEDSEKDLLDEIIEQVDFGNKKEKRIKELEVELERRKKGQKEHVDTIVKRIHAQADQLTAQDKALIEKNRRIAELEAEHEELEKENLELRIVVGMFDKIIRDRKPIIDELKAENEKLKVNLQIRYRTDERRGK